MIPNQKNSCTNCSYLMEKYSFNNPKQYSAILNDMAEAISSRQFVITEQTCDFSSVKQPNGTWYSDIISHSIRCLQCGTHFTCSCDTYHGNGFFGKYVKQGEEN